MKKIMMIAAMMVATVAAKAQFEPGTFSFQPKVGFNLASVTADDTKYKPGFAVGLEGQYQMNNWFGLSAAVMYQQQGTKVKNIDDLKWNIDYVNIPLMAKFYVTKGLSLNVGLQPGFMVKSKLKVDDADLDVKDACNKFDLSVPLSIAYELPMGLTFEARYTYGVTNVGKDAFDSKNSTYDKLYKNKNDVFQITVGYKFSLN
jgi:hypothetical protein